MKKVFLFTLFTFFVSNIWSQFLSSENVYCFQYDYTSNDGIKSKKGSEAFYFVNFQKDMMGLAKETNLKYLKKKMLEEPTYYENAARHDLANGYSNWKSNPSSRHLWDRAWIIKYNEQYSTYSKYTYRSYSKSIGMHIQYGYLVWSEPSWDSKCYTFSKDGTEMIIWSTDDPENRDYYKLIDASALKPNIDFLY